MFYLLEDNRIIDSQIPYAHAKSLPFYEDKTGHLRVKDRIGKSYQVFKYDKIINRSENVFDLVICCQDLIETEEGQFYKPLKLQIDSFVVKYDCCVLFNGIKAIYKPDGKGNYIKVWERKDENEKNNKI